MNSMTKAFFVGLTDELEKAGKCATPGEKIRSKGKGKGLAIGQGKGPIGIPKKAAVSSIKAKIEAARRDPSTKANPKDTGPKGSGTKDPRFVAMKKKAEEAFFDGFNKDAATVVPGPRGTSERKNVAGMLRSMRGISWKPGAAKKLRKALQRGK